jgi:HrpA-like RNA helicase
MPLAGMGRRMSALPLDPCLSRALLAAADLGCLSDMLVVAGMLSPEGSIFLGGKGPKQLVAGGDQQRREEGR